MTEQEIMERFALEMAKKDKRIEELEMENKDGGPAFPVVGMSQRNGQEFLSILNGGMSLLDYFAAAALTGLCSKDDRELDLIASVAQENGDRLSDALTKLSYEMARAMIAGRKSK